MRGLGLGSFDGGVGGWWLPVCGPFEMVDSSEGEWVEEEQGVGVSGLGGDAFGDGVCEFACEVAGGVTDSEGGLIEDGEFGGDGGVDIDLLEFEFGDLDFE